jgi:hypothetical protein
MGTVGRCMRPCLLELEPHHPVGQTAGRHLCCRSGCEVELERRHASPMIPLESSALSMTLIALASALWVTAYTSAGSGVGIAASKLSGAANSHYSSFRFSVGINTSIPVPLGAGSSRSAGNRQRQPPGRSARSCGDSLNLSPQLRAS